MTPDYFLWTKDALITKIIELEDQLHPSEAEALVAKLPIRLSPHQRIILAILYAAGESFVATDTLIGQVHCSDASLKVQINKLRGMIRPHGITITSRYGRGYSLDNPSLLKELAYGKQSNQGPANSNRTNSRPGPFHYVTKEKANAKV